jgi:hypothetical protein
MASKTSAAPGKRRRIGLPRLKSGEPHLLFHHCSPDRSLGLTIIVRSDARRGAGSGRFGAVSRIRRGRGLGARADRERVGTNIRGDTLAVATAMSPVEFLDGVAPHALGFRETAIQELVPFEVFVKESEQALVGGELSTEFVNVLQMPPGSGDLSDYQFFFFGDWVISAIEVIANPVEIEIRGGILFRKGRCCCWRRHEFVSFRLQNSRRDGDFVRDGPEVVERRRDVGCEHPSIAEGKTCWVEVWTTRESLTALDRASVAREHIEATGMVITNEQTGVQHTNPAIKIEAESRRQFMQG